MMLLTSALMRLMILPRSMDCCDLQGTLLPSALETEHQADAACFPGAQAWL